LLAGAWQITNCKIKSRPLRDLFSESVFLRLQCVGWYHSNGMVFPIKVCTVCSEEFELKPDKPGFANRCPECSETEQVDSLTKQSVDADERKSLREANEARRQAMRDLLYCKDS